LRLEELGRLEPLDPRVPASRRRYMLGATNTTIPDLPKGQTPYVGQQGMNGVVRISFGGQTYDYLIRLDDDCLWTAAPPQGLVLPVTGPPAAGLPVSLCP
jgi:hypothetical protein